MQLFYTGATADNQSQTISSKSLGGYVSNTMIPNDVMNNLFGTFGKVDNKYKEYRLIAVKNLTGKTILNANIWIETGTDSFGKYKLAAVAPSKDNCNNNVFEIIHSSNAKPYFATFEEATDESTAIEITNISIDETFGIWIERTASEYAISKNSSNQSCEDLENDFKNNVKIPTEENVNFIIDFTVED